jgi:hypothetical protein
MNWEQHFCPNQGCSIDGWMVRRSPGNDALWHLAGRAGGAFTVAALSPICPRCGTTLRPTIEQVHDAGGNVLADEPVPEFARSLGSSVERSG